MIACGFLFLRRIETTGSLMSDVAKVPVEQSDCPDLADYRLPRSEHFMDVAAYAMEIVGGDARNIAWRAAFHFGRALLGSGHEVLWRAGTRPAGPWRISEVRAAEEEARDAERRRYPSWDDW